MKKLYSKRREKSLVKKKMSRVMRLYLFILGITVYRCMQVSIHKIHC